MQRDIDILNKIITEEKTAAKNLVISAGTEPIYRQGYINAFHLLGVLNRLCKAKGDIPEFQMSRGVAYFVDDDSMIRHITLKNEHTDIFVNSSTNVINYDGNSTEKAFNINLDFNQCNDLEWHSFMFRFSVKILDALDIYNTDLIKVIDRREDT